MTTATPPADERVRKVGILGKLLARPELGAVAGAILVFVFFAVVAGDSGFLTSVGTIGYLEVSAQLGILVIPVALLMVAGEFDLSVGSMVGAAGMLIAIPTVEFGWPLWAALLLAFGCRAARRVPERVPGRKDGASVLYRDAGHALRAEGGEHRVHPPHHGPHPGLGVLARRGAFWPRSSRARSSASRSPCCGG